MAVISDTSEIFPNCPTYGFRASPRYLVKFVTREGGFERRDLKWEQPLHTYDAVPLGEQMEQDQQAVLYFWHAMRGMATLFRFKDWNDYKSCQLQATVTALDQPLRLLAGSPTGRQLVKRYTHGSLTLDRDITRPVGSTIIVANGSGVTQPTSSYTIDERTGLLTVNGTFSGTPTSWGGEFYVPVRFASELDIELTNYKIQRLSFALTEIRAERLT